MVKRHKNGRTCRNWKYLVSLSVNFTRKTFVENNVSAFNTIKRLQSVDTSSRVAVSLRSEIF